MQQSLVLMNEVLSEIRKGDKEIKINNNTSPTEFFPTSTPAVHPYKGNNIYISEENKDIERPSRGISTFTLNLELLEKENSNFYRKTKNYVHQGTYAEGILISAVDASVGLSSQEDPRPVLIRLKGEAISASHKGKKERTNVSGCVIIGGQQRIFLVKEYI